MYFYGQGLTLCTGLSFGKSPDVAAVRKFSTGIRPYTSLNESSFKRGVAVSVGKKKWNADAFYSNRKLDANLNSILDSTLEQQDIFTSFIESGYHRTTSVQVIIAPQANLKTKIPFAKKCMALMQDIMCATFLQE